MQRVIEGRRVNHHVRDSGGFAIWDRDDSRQYFLQHLDRKSSLVSQTNNLLIFLKIVGARVCVCFFVCLDIRRLVPSPSDKKWNWKSFCGKRWNCVLSWSHEQEDRDAKPRGCGQVKYEHVNTSIDDMKTKRLARICSDSSISSSARESCWTKIWIQARRMEWNHRLEYSLTISRTTDWWDSSFANEDNMDVVCATCFRAITWPKVTATPVNGECSNRSWRE